MSFSGNTVAIGVRGIVVDAKCLASARMTRGTRALMQLPGRAVELARRERAKN